MGEVGKIDSNLANLRKKLLGLKRTKGGPLDNLGQIFQFLQEEEGPTPHHSDFIVVHWVHWQLKKET